MEQVGSSLMVALSFLTPMAGSLYPEATMLASLAEEMEVAEVAFACNGEEDNENQVDG